MIEITNILKTTKVEKIEEISNMDISEILKERDGLLEKQVVGQSMEINIIPPNEPLKMDVNALVYGDEGVAMEQEIVEEEEFDDEDLLDTEEDE